MTMRVFIRNIAGGDTVVVLQGVLYLASPACQSVPVTSGHLQCTDTFAWSRRCPFMTGTTVLNMSLLYIYISTMFFCFFKNHSII